MFKNIRVKLNERVVIFKDGLPRKSYGPGRHRLWGRRLTEQRFNTDELVFRALPEVRAILEPNWFAEVVLQPWERGVLYRDAFPMLFLRPGTHRYWTVDPSVKLQVLDVREPLPALTREFEALIPGSEYVDVTVEEHEQGLLFVQGVLTSTLSPGRYRRWTTPEAKVQIRAVDLRRQSVSLAAQELMTRDKVTLRLTLTADYTVADPATVARRSANPAEALYLAVQLAARDYVASVTLDELLEGRTAFTEYLDRQVRPLAESWGLRLEQLGVKDVVLPGEMKALLNRVIEAEKEAAANVILRREEAAATRTMANAARVMQDLPVLLRLKELESLEKIAASIDEVRVVVGAEGLSHLLPTELVTRAPRG